MRKLGILLTALALTAVLVLMVLASGILPLSREEGTPVVWELKNVFTSAKEESEDHSYPLVPSLTVQNPLGDISVHGTNGGEIRVTLSKRAEAKTLGRVGELLEKISLEAKENPEGTELIVHLPKDTPNEKVRADLRLEVPKGVTLNLHAGLGRVSVTAYGGQLKVINKLGPIELVEYHGSAALEAHLGNIHITDSTFTDELVAITHLGDVHAAALLAQENVLESNLGDITLLLSPDEAYVLEGSVGLGDFATDLPFKGERSSSSIKGIIGEGEHRGMIFVDVSLGSLQLTKREE